MSASSKPSVTVAAIVERDGRFLIVEEDTADGVRLNQPAGHWEQGESLIDAVKRETLEETGHRFEPTGFLGAYMSRYTSAKTGEDVTYVRFAFVGELGEVVAGAELSPEIRRVAFMSADDLRMMNDLHRSPLVMRCIDDYLAGRRLPLDTIYTHPSVLESAA
ncbi:MAG TPA: NUDIX hydrolase [Burkholderiaceae bacterium]|nr:NUDIX hydrolase [Burkholderiaceae bacterium]